MKIWKYYLKPNENLIEETTKILEEEDVIVPLNTKYPLFGLTCEKNIKKAFEDIYDIDKFIKVDENVTKEEYKEYAARNRGKVLEMYDFMGVKNHWKKNQEIIVVTIPISFITRQHVEELINPGFGGDYWIGTVDDFVSPYEFIDPKYKNALDKIGYTAAYNYYFDMFARDYGYDAIGNLPESDYNTLEWFVRQFGEILRGE